MWSFILGIPHWDEPNSSSPPTQLKTKFSKYISGADSFDV